MKWLMGLSIVGAVLLSVLAGLVVAQRVASSHACPAQVVPALRHGSDAPLCPGQLGHVCPAAGRKAAADLQA
jgi:hypothetical protein